MRLAGVAFGLATPSHAFFRPKLFVPRARDLVGRVEVADAASGRASVDDAGDDADDEEALEADALNELITLSAESQPPLDRLEHLLLPWTTFLIVPVFALANAGVRVGWDDLTSSFSEPVTLGVMLGLVVGKPVGIMVFALLAIRLGIGKQPAGASTLQMLGVAILGGVGFTVALFVTELAFEPGTLADQAKIGILAASTIAGVAGYLFLRTVSRSTDAE